MIETRPRPASMILDLGPARVSELPEMLPFHLWRGRSGRRYLVAVHQGELEPAENSVVLLVTIDNGMRHICGTLSFGQLDANAGQRLRLAATAAGVHEVHVHLLAQTESERAAMMRDLSPPKRRTAAPSA